MHQDLARELKKIWNMKMTVVPIVIGALGTFTRVLVHELADLEIRGRVVTTQTTALVRSARIPRRDLTRLAVVQTPGKRHQQTLV